MDSTDGTSKNRPQINCRPTASAATAQDNNNNNNNNNNNSSSIHLGRILGFHSS